MLLLTIAYETPLVLPYVRISVQIVMQERVIILFIDPLGVDHIAQLFTGQQGQSYHLGNYLPPEFDGGLPA